MWMMSLLAIASARPLMAPSACARAAVAGARSAIAVRQASVDASQRVADFTRTNLLKRRTGLRCPSAPGGRRRAFELARERARVAPLRSGATLLRKVLPK